MKKEILIALRISREMHERLEARSQEQDLSVAWIIRKAVDNYLIEENNNKKKPKKKRNN